ncbi:MAG: FKBP-type peptidyl-prolyl cis-trans isomerase [Acidimicrobiia bacterium]|nr:FKBP-type peptidyl-prolyl cis-trans isomerase [Acidimicrobiia bacterium]
MLNLSRRFGAFLVLPVLALALAACGSSDPSPGKIATNPAGPAAPPSSTTTTGPFVQQAEQKPCVAEVGPGPAGAPDVPVKVGPAPTTLVIEDLKVGDGAETVPTSSVTVDYIGVACSTGVIFDSSYKTGQPAPFALSGVIKGWSEGLVGMKAGGQRLLGIPSDLAYGASGQGADIGPNEALWFVVTLNSVS